MLDAVVRQPIPSLSNYGIKSMSMGYLVDEKHPWYGAA
jgi:hypothetical protein